MYIGKIKTRFRTLFIPYVLWNTATALCLSVHFRSGNLLSRIVGYFQEFDGYRIFWNCNAWTTRDNWLGDTLSMSGPIDLPLWFLRDLIVLSLLTPLIYWFVKTTRWYGIMLLLLAYVSGIWPEIPGLSINSVFFFTAGAYLSLQRKNLVMECRRVAGPSCILALATLGPLIWFDGNNTFAGSCIYPFYILFGVITVINVAANWIERGCVRVHSVLSGSSFFIYASHAVVILPLCGMLARKIVPWNDPLMLTVRYFMIPLMTIAVCLGIYILMKRFIPRLLNVFTGDR